MLLLPLLAASLASPLASLTEFQWPILANAGGVRYWFIPMLGFVTILVWLQQFKKFPKVRVIATLSLMLMLIGIPLDWSHHPFPDLNFRAYAEKFAEARQGTKFKIPINPSGWL